MAFYGYQDPIIDPLTQRPRVPGSMPGMPIPRPVVASQAAQAPQAPLPVGGLPQPPQIAPQAPPPMPTPLDMMPPPPSMPSPPDLSTIDNPPPDLRPTNVRDLTAPSLTTPSIPDVPQTSQPYRDALAYELANPPKPKLWQRLAAGAVGGLAGAVNASGRTRIDPRVTEGATRGILMGGYDDRVARAGSLAQLERQREQDAEDARYKNAQITQMGETSRLREAAQSLTEAERQRVEHQRQVAVATSLRQSSGRPLSPGEPVPVGFYKHPEPVLGQTWIVPTAETSRRLIKEAEVEANSVPTNPILGKWFRDQTGTDLGKTVTKSENDTLLRLYSDFSRQSATSAENESNRAFKREMLALARSAQASRTDAQTQSAMMRVAQAIGGRFDKMNGTETREAELHYNTLQNAANEMKTNPAAAKHAIIVSYLKLIDNNAVKEGEVKALQAAQSLRDKANAALQSLSKGGFVSDEFIKEVLAVSTGLYNSYQTKYAESLRSVNKMARGLGLGDAQIGYIAMRPWEEIEPIINAVPSGTLTSKPAQKTPPPGVVPFTPVR